MLVPHETLDAEFLSLAGAEGVADIEELNKVLERAVNLKNFLKGQERVQKVAQFVAEHYRENVETARLQSIPRRRRPRSLRPLQEGPRSGVRPRGPAAEYSEVVYTGNNNDSALLKEFHLDPKKEWQIRKSFGKLDQQPKILIVTEKLLTGFDAPVLYATLEELLAEGERNEARKKQQAEKRFDGLTFFVFRTLLDAKIGNAEEVSRKIKDAFIAFPNWKRSEDSLRELRKKVTFANFAETDDLDEVTGIVDELFRPLERASKI